MKIYFFMPTQAQINIQNILLEALSYLKKLDEILLRFKYPLCSDKDVLRNLHQAQGTLLELSRYKTEF